MVYTGKPSRACATCKKRRIKCDEGRPACGQCIKSKRGCYGYKTEAELMFRDETYVTAQRAARKSTRATSPPDSASSSSSNTSQQPVNFDEVSFPAAQSAVGGAAIDGDPEHVETLSISNPLWYQEQPLASPNPALSMSLHEQANAYFFNHFTLYGTEHSFHMYDILQELYKKADANDPIRATTDAVSILTLSRKRGYESVRAEAARSYANAVREVAAAVADPARVREDETLLSVIMLGFAETMDVTTVSQPGLAPRYSHTPGEAEITKFHQAWGAHAAGAEVIVRARGIEDMIKSKNSLHLAGFVRLQTIHRHLFTAKPMEDIEELWKPLEDLKDKLPVFAGPITLASIALQIPALRHRGHTACRKPMEPGLGDELSDLLSEVYNVDSQLCSWLDAMRRKDGFHIAGYYTEPLSMELYHERVWPGAVFNHDALMIMNGMNLCRVYRLFTNMLIFNILERLVAPDLLKTQGEYLKCTEAIEAVVTDICSTIPYGLGYLHDIPLSPIPLQSHVGTFVTPGLESDFVHTFQEAQRSESGNPRSSTGHIHHDDDDEKTGPAIGAWYLIWPLYVAYAMVLISPPQRDWIRGRIKYIGDKFGIARGIMHQMKARQAHEPFRRRRFSPLDFMPPPWEPLQ